MITSYIGALNETVANRGILIDGNWTSPEYKEKFIDSVVEAMNKEDESDRSLLHQYAIENFGLDQLSQEWETMFYDLIEELKTNPITPYMPTIGYK